MDNAQRIKLLNTAGKDVFSCSDAVALWGMRPAGAKIALKRMVGKGLIVKLAKGYYALSADFDIYELANIIIRPSYVSCHSALFYHGVSFQLTSDVISAARINYKKTIAGKTYIYHSMKEALFFNLEGINYKNNLAMAAPERALLDAFYFGLLPNLDNPDKINKYQAQKLAQYYPKSVGRKLKQILS